jgi:hypothetical protein
MKRSLKTTSLPAGLISLALFGALLAPSSALASWEELLQQACGTKGQVTGTFTQAEFKEALANIPADADQYSNCRAILEATQLNAATGSAATSQSQAETILATATPAEQQALATAVNAASKGTSAQVGDVTVDPAAFGTTATATAAVNNLPLSLKIMLVLLGAGSAVALGAVLIPRARNYYASR